MADLDAELARVWGTHRGEIDARMATMDAAVALLRDDALDDESRASAARAAHQLAGTAGTFGFGDASEHAAALELGLAVPPDRMDATELARLMVVLRTALPGPGS